MWGQLRKGLRHRAYPGWFARWADIEAEATALPSYEPLLVPGLLQTEDYARAILSARPGGDDDDLEEQVAARMERQAIVSQPGGPLLWCVLDEGVLHRPVGGGKVMRTQLERLAGLADHQKTTVQVIPAAAVRTRGCWGRSYSPKLRARRLACTWKPRRKGRSPRTLRWPLTSRCVSIGSGRRRCPGERPAT